MVVTVFLKARAVSRQNEEVFTNGFADSSPWSLDRFPLSKGDFQNAGVHRDICLSCSPQEGSSLPHPRERVLFSWPGRAGTPSLPSCVKNCGASAGRLWMDRPVCSGVWAWHRKQLD